MKTGCPDICRELITIAHNEIHVWKFGMSKEHTVILCYRRLHKKGVEEEVTKRRTRRTQKFQRAIVGASLTDIMAKR